MVGLLHDRASFVETGEEEETFGLSEEDVVVLGEDGEGLVTEGGQGVLKSSVLEKDLSCVLVDSGVVRPQSWLVHPCLPMYSCRSRKASLPSPSICRHRDRSRKHSARPPSERLTAAFRSLIASPKLCTHANSIPRT